MIESSDYKSTEWQFALFTKQNPDVSKYIIEKLNLILNSIWCEIKRDVEQALVAGEWKVFARMNNCRHPSGSVPIDVWENFRIENWELGKAIADATGETLFSIHFVPAPNAIEKPRYTINAVIMSL